MYQYDKFDQQLVDQRVAQFRDQVKRRLTGELSEAQFRPLRLMNGLYLQLHAYMLRVAIPYGTLNSDQLRMLAHIARTYDRDYGHFTTRQNLQYHWPALKDAPDILADLAKVEMHAIQTSGNCIRNITSDPYAGAAGDEIEDPRAYCEIVRQWSSLHPEFSFLPRKFKIAITSSPNDRAAVRVHDIGLRMVQNDSGETGFEVLVGGGLGRTPMIGKVIREFLPKEDMLSYLEAILRIYNLYGRRDNKFKARIKILVHELGAERITELVEAEWREMKDSALKLTAEEVARVQAYFAPPAFEELPAEEPEFDVPRFEEKAFAAWREVNLLTHKVPGYAIVNLSLKPEGATPGDATAGQMDGVAALADKYSFGEIRVTYQQNLVLPHVRQSDLVEVWRAVKALGFATPNIGLASDIICCPGLDYCSLANARSIPIAQRLSESLGELERKHGLGNLEIKMSGCINACGHHHVGHIGILGVDKKGVEFYQVTLGGAADEDAAIGKIIGPAFSTDEVVEAVETLMAAYVELRQEGERFIDTYRRLGIQPFKEKIYAAH